MLDLVLESAFRLGRLLQAFSRAIKFPAVVRATNALLIDPAECQRSFAMRTLLGEHAVASGLVSIYDKIFTEEAESLDRLVIAKLAGTSHRHPVAP
jgi:hypothetical protein